MPASLSRIAQREIVNRLRARKNPPTNKEAIKLVEMLLRLQGKWENGSVDVVPEELKPDSVPKPPNLSDTVL